jgi:prepilin-type N-terminal cleavage/methylation domain-containing protein
MKKGFTLLELIIVIVILGILATLGYTQYSKQVESMRLAEAKVMIGLMRKLATEYYLKNGSITGIQNSDVGVDATCDSTNYYKYGIYAPTSERVLLMAQRCTSGGKLPNYASAPYCLYLTYYPGSGGVTWGCTTGSNQPCYGLPCPPEWVPWP